MRLALLFTLLAVEAASARPLEQIKSSGTISACLPANALPFSRRNGEPHGFQVDLAREVAHQLGVSLEEQWVISPIQAQRANCDIRLDVIADVEAQHASRLSLSKAYYRSGVVIAARPERGFKSLADLNERTKVAVMVGSITSMVLSQRHVGLTTYAFEDEMLAAVAAGEADAAMVTPASAAFYNLNHSDAKLSAALPEDATEGMAWNIAIGMKKPDPALGEAIDGVIDKLVADGTMKGIYARYGMTLPAPK
jgi:polar amino acid transport system substrate-binding protein